MDDDASAPVARVQRADAGDRVVVLEARIPGQTATVIVAATRARSGAGLLPRGARRDLWGGRLPAGAERRRAREDALTGAAVLAIADGEIAIEPPAKDREREDGDARSVQAPRFVRAFGHARVAITDAASSPQLTPIALALGDEREAWEARGLALARAVAAEAIEVRRDELARALDRARARIDRRRAAITEDLAKIAKAAALASQAQWLIAEAARAPRGATKLVVTDWSSGEPVPLEVPLDPAKGAREQVEAMFKRAKRLKLGARVAEERLALADRQRDAVARAAEALASHGAEAATLADIERVAADAKRAAPRDVSLPQAIPSGPRSKEEKSARTPYRTFVAPSGRRLLVGKGAADNDALTMRVARPHDLWLHAKDRAGAHVIVPLDKGQTCPSDDLVSAAHLAAHFSDARGEAVVDVQHTPKRYLRKPKGSAPGFVVASREKVLVLRVESARLRALLDREET